MPLWFSGELRVMNSVDAVDFILSLSHPISLIPDTICYKILKIFILIAPGLSCSAWNLRSPLQPAGSLVVA